MKCHRHWAGKPERGTDRAARLLLRLLTLPGGWRVGEQILPIITLYFLLTDHVARRASRDYLRRALGRLPSWLDLFRHFHTFGGTILDRVFLLTGREKFFQIDVEGLDALAKAQQPGRGAILLGSHFGSFAVLCALAERSPVKARAFMYRQNLGAITRLLEALAPHLQQAIIEIGTPDAMLRVQESLYRGELVGMLGDRAPSGERFLHVPFFGERAPFPAGPLLVAAMLDAPIVLFYGIRTGHRRYRVGFEHFADHIILPRGERMARLEVWLADYARRLEELCRQHPFNWFNFYDFWNSTRDESDELARDRLPVNPVMATPCPSQ